MKSTVEQLSPTRVRINVEVPFEELQPDFDRAFQSLAGQVRIPGFRPGKAPRKILEARVGRGAVLEQVVNDAIQSRYSEAVTANEVKAIGQPEIDITKLEDNVELVFAAEVDVRPEVTLPDFSEIAVTVDPVEISDEDIEEQLLSLRQRFGTLTGVERAVQDGDFVSIDLSARSTVKKSPRLPPRVCPTRSAPASSSRVSTRPSSVSRPAGRRSSPPHSSPVSSRARKPSSPSR